MTLILIIILSFYSNAKEAEYVDLFDLKDFNNYFTVTGDVFEYDGVYYLYASKLSATKRKEAIEIALDLSNLTYFAKFKFKRFFKKTCYQMPDANRCQFTVKGNLKTGSDQLQFFKPDLITYIPYKNNPTKDIQVFL